MGDNDFGGNFTSMAPYRQVQVIELLNKKKQRQKYEGKFSCLAEGHDCYDDCYYNCYGD